MKAQTPLKLSTATPRTLPILVLSLLLALILPGVLRATDYTWAQTAAGATYTWTNTADWTPTPAVGAYPGKNITDYDTVDFRVALAGNQTVFPKLGTASGFSNSISVMKIGGNGASPNNTWAYSFTKGSLSTPRIAFITSGADALLQKSGDGNDIFATGGFNLANNLDVVFTGGAGSLELAITIAEINAGMALNVSGPGKLILSAGNNSYTGGTSIQQATVQFNDQLRFGTNTITLGNGGTLVSSNGATLGANRPLLLKGGGTGKLATFAAGNVFAVAGAIASDSGSPASLTCAGPGTIKLTAAANTYTTDTLLTGGTLDILGGGLSGSGALSVSNGATLGVDASGGSPLSVSSLTLGAAGAGTVTLNLTNGTLSGNPSSPVISSGALSALATNIVINLSGSGYQVGTSFPLIGYTGTPLSSITNFTLVLTPPLPGTTNVLVNNTANPSIDVQIVATVNTLTWSGAVNNQWETTLQNWKLGSNPTNYHEYVFGSVTVGDSVQFDDTLSNPSSTGILITTPVVPASVLVNNSAYNYSFSQNPIGGSGVLTKSGTGVLTFLSPNSYSGGTIDSGGTLQLGVDNALGTGLVTFSGGALSSVDINPRTLTNNLKIVADATLGDTSNYGALTNSGQVNLANGTPNLTIASTVTLVGKVITGGFNKEGAGTLTLLGANTYAGGTTLSDGAIQVGNGGTNGTLGTGTVSVSSGTTLTFYRGDLDNAPFTIANGISDSGTVIFNGTGVLDQSAYTLTGNNSGFTGPMILNNCRVSVGAANRLGSSTVTVNNGSGVYLSGAAVWYNVFNIVGSGWPENAATNGLGAVRFSNGSQLGYPVHLYGDAVLNTYSAAVMGMVSGAIDDSGHSPSGITKANPGTLVLSGNNTYSGATLVSAGTLAAAASGALPTGSALVVSNGAAFATSNAVTVNPASVNLQAGSKLVLDVTSATTPDTAPINTSVLTPNISGGTNVTIVVTNDSPFVVGTYPLIKYSGMIGGDGFAAFQLAPATGVIGSLTNDGSDGIIYLNVSAIVNALTWNGGVNSKWDKTTLNWNGAGGLTNYQEYAAGVGDIVTFDDTLANPPLSTNITITTAVTPGAVTVNNTTYNYVFSGSPISGMGALTKSGTSVLTLSSANSYSGGTIITGGTLQVGNDNALGTNRVTLSGGALSSDSTNPRTLANNLLVSANVNPTLGDGTNTGVLTVSGSVDLGADTHNLTIASPVTFSNTVNDGGFSKRGTDTLTLKGTASLNNSFITANGTTVLDGATVTARNTPFRVEAVTNTVGAPMNARLIVTNGAQLTVASTGINALYIGFSGAGAGATNYMDVAGFVTVTNQKYNSFVFQKNGAHGVVTLLPNGVAQVGTIDVNGSGVNNTEFDFNGGVLRAMATTITGNFFRNILGAAYVWDSGAIIDSSNYSITIAQPLLAGPSGSGGLTKIGSGTLTLANAHTYVGATVVSNGTLALAGTGSIAASSGIALSSTATFDVTALTNFTLGSSQTLSGNGTVAGAITNNGTLAPGIGGIGTLTCNSNLTLNTGAVELFELNKTNGAATNDYLVVGNTLVVNGSTLTVANVGPALVAGDTFKLFSQAVGGSGFSTVTLPTLDGGLAWTNHLADDGTIAVVSAVVTPPPAITSIAPSSGVTNGGTLVTVNGSNFQSGMTVQFGANTPVVATFISAAQVTVLTPANAVGAVNVTVQNPDAQSATLTSGYMYVLPAPTIASVNPSSGRTNGGTLVTVTGTYFVSGMTVQFGANTPVAATVVSATQATASTPVNAAGAVNVTVQNPDTQTATLTSGFAYVLPPAAATIRSVVKSGTNLVLVWVGGASNSCPLLTATNVTQTRATWTPVVTNAVGGDGLSTNSIPITVGEAKRFYLLSIPYN